MLKFPFKCYFSYLLAFRKHRCFPIPSYSYSKSVQILFTTDLMVLFIFPFKTVIQSESFILGLSTFQLKLIVFTLFFSENTGKLQVHHIHVPNPFILGSSGDLHCNYSWTHPEQESRPIYSIKWYKENAEFFR